MYTYYKGEYTNVKSQLNKLLDDINSDFKAFLIANPIISNELITTETNAIKALITAFETFAAGTFSYTIHLNKNEKGEWFIDFKPLDLYTFITFFGYKIDYENYTTQGEFEQITLEDIGLFYMYQGFPGFTPAAGKI